MLRTGQISRETRFGNLGLNNQMFDLGMEPTELDVEDAVEAKIRELDATMDLVLISEMMDESLVLLAERLCWPLHYMAIFTKNARKQGRDVRYIVITSLGDIFGAILLYRDAIFFPQPTTNTIFGGRK